MNALKVAWESFNKEGIPEEASYMHRKHMQVVFYTGAESVLQLARSLVLADSPEALKAAMQGLMEVHQELRRFAEEAGIASE